MKEVLEKGTRSVRGCNDQKQSRDKWYRREKYIQQRGGHKVTITLGKKCVA